MTQELWHRIMSLDESQRKKVIEWIGQGLKLSEIQNHLTSEFGLRLTYMDVRLLVDDLKVTPKDVEKPKSLPSTPLTAPGPTPAQNSPAPGKAAPPAQKPAQ